MISDENARLAAKRTNESIKLSANLLNNLAVGVLVGGLIAPSSTGRDVSTTWLGLLVVAFGLHLAGRLLLRGLQSED
jgi:hypothetical protein